MEDDWDLHAVVRGCAVASTTTSSAVASSFPADLLQPGYCFSSSRQDYHFLSLPDPFETRNSVGELNELFLPFFPQSQHPLSPPPALPISAESGILQGSRDQKQQNQQQLNKQRTDRLHIASVSTPSTHSQTPRSKRRKNQQKKVCNVSAESLSDDIWSWRKYGQKPIKGSPYPRGYYRCSSSKGCLARKQVERNRSDPEMFIVTYTAEHNHPAPTHKNSLAGSTRQKPVAAVHSNPPVAKPSYYSSISTPSTEDEALQQNTDAMKEENEEEISVEDIMIEENEDDDLNPLDSVFNDNFFDGLDEITEPFEENCFSDDFPSTISLPWLNRNAAAAGSI